MDWQLVQDLFHQGTACSVQDREQLLKPYQETHPEEAKEVCLLWDHHGTDRLSQLKTLSFQLLKDEAVPSKAPNVIGK